MVEWEMGDKNPASKLAGFWVGVALAVAAQSAARYSFAFLISLSSQPASS